MKKISGYIFDLDGVIVDTTEYHYNSWRRLANKLGFDITLEQNENLKGVSRMESLEYILSVGSKKLSSSEKVKMAELKNLWYMESINDLDASKLLPGAKALLKNIRQANCKIALGSASTNSFRILKATGIVDFFDTIIDGTKTTKSKPDPQVFLMGAEAIGLTSSECVVFEDSINGIKAANTGGFISIGVGDSHTLSEADFVIPGLENTSVNSLQIQIEKLNYSEGKKV